MVFFCAFNIKKIKISLLLLVQFLVKIIIKNKKIKNVHNKNIFCYKNVEKKLSL